MASVGEHASALRRMTIKKQMYDWKRYMNLVRTRVVLHLKISSLLFA